MKKKKILQDITNSSFWLTCQNFLLILSSAQILPMFSFVQKKKNCLVAIWRRRKKSLLNFSRANNKWNLRWMAPKKKRKPFLIHNQLEYNNKKSWMIIQNPFFKQFLLLLLLHSFVPRVEHKNNLIVFQFIKKVSGEFHKKWDYDERLPIPWPMTTSSDWIVFN